MLYFMTHLFTPFPFCAKFTPGAFQALGSGKHISISTKQTSRNSHYLSIFVMVLFIITHFWTRAPRCSSPPITLMTCKPIAL